VPQTNDQSEPLNETEIAGILRAAGRGEKAYKAFIRQMNLEEDERSFRIFLLYYLEVLMEDFIEKETVSLSLREFVKDAVALGPKGVEN